jgi:pimeloyl-ACP methyl ester carboxylesterase
MAYLGAFYRTYAMDFWGFGESGKKRETYAVSDFVDLVNQFMNQLGIAHAPLVGHSMGGTVSLSVAIRYPIPSGSARWWWLVHPSRARPLRRC